MRLIIVRHGETNENVREIVQGQTYGTLSEKGRKQAKLLAQRLKDEKLDIIFSSDLERARDTTVEIVKFHPGVPVEYTALIRERNLGSFEGRTIAELRAAQKEEGMPKYKWVPPDGESYLHILERARKFLDRIMKEHRDKTVLVVSHGGFIRSLLSLVLDKPIREMSEAKVPNTCVNILELKSDHKFEVRVLSSVDHLDSETETPWVERK
jgi:broad specificity phosphatase PhoE